MKIQKDELGTILSKFNPWWQGEAIFGLPMWKRAAFGEILKWVKNPPTNRATFISGARQIGKTTLLMQVIAKLLGDGVPASNIFYATFDHPMLKLAGIDAAIEAWRHREPRKDGLEYVFLDEAQFINDWGTWVKHQVDFNKQRRVVFTGSVTPILQENQESGLGRWHNIRLTTLSFYEFIRLKKIDLLPLTSIKSLKEIFDWNFGDFARIGEIAQGYIPHFHDYLLRGGFPQSAIIDDANQAQKLLREDVIDKALKRDMTAMFGVRRVLELEQVFLYLCLRDGATLDFGSLCSTLGNLKQPTARNFIDLLETAHLIYRLTPFGYGKEVLRGKQKIYLADPAIAPAVMLKGKSFIDNAEELGVAAESAVLKHLIARYYQQNIRFSYWQNKKGLEVDLVAEVNDEIIPFEVKYRANHTSINDCRGLSEFCSKKNIKRGYIITKSASDFQILEEDKNSSSKSNLTDFKKVSENKVKILKIPAAIFCYFMGELENS